MRPLFAALRFLTILPVPESWTGGEKGLERCLPFFPVAGLLIGLSAVLLDNLFAGLLPPLPGAVLIVAFLIAVSGGFHMDGLADTADGFLSARPKNEILRIMKDSRTGPMGVIAVCTVILLKTALMGSMHPDLRLQALVLMPLAGRTALVFMITVLPYARPEGGLATALLRRRSRIDMLWAAAFLFLAGWTAAGVKGLAVAACALAAAALFAFYSRRKIGGFTGDTLGAACELTETVPALVMIILQGV